MDSDQDPEFPEVEAPRKSRHCHGHGRNSRNTGESKSSGQGQIRSREQKSSPRTRRKCSKDSNAVDSTTKVYSNQNERREDVWSSISSLSTDEDELRTGLGADVSRKGEAIAFAGPGHSHGYVIRVKQFAEPLSALGTAAKEPWVPAPGRTTRVRINLITLQLAYLKCTMHSFVYICSPDQQSRPRPVVVTRQSLKLQHH